MTRTRSGLQIRPGFCTPRIQRRPLQALIMSVLMEPVGMALASELYPFSRSVHAEGSRQSWVSNPGTVPGAGQGGETLTGDSSRSRSSDVLISGKLALIEVPTRPAGEAESTLLAEREGEQEEAVVPEDLVLEAWTVVKDTFLDARGAGYTGDKWEAAKAQALKRRAKHPGSTHSHLLYDSFPQGPLLQVPNARPVCAAGQV